MRVERLPPLDQLNLGAETPAREAASVIVLREGAPFENAFPRSDGAPSERGNGMEVLLVQRNPDASFMGGVWVFPGGSVMDEDDGPEGAALRELEEEAGLSLPGGRDALVPFSRWITPAEVKVRFDTRFFVAEAPAGVEATCDGTECVDLRWLRPAEALAAGERNELRLVFPTIKHLEQLAELRSVAHTFEVARGLEVVPIQPRVVTGDGSVHVLLPGEPGYHD